MRVVVTRPPHSGERTSRRLRDMGHEPVLLPLTRPVRDADAAAVGLAETTGAITATSAEAIRTIESLGPALAPHLGRPFFAVGRATADEASRIGFATVFHSNGDGAALARLIAAHAAPMAASPVAYLAGSPRAPGFEAMLGQLCISCRTIECYRMTEVEPNEEELKRNLLDDPADAVLFYSRHTAESFFRQPVVRHHLLALARIRLLCLSAAVAEAVPPSLRERTEIAAIPDENHLLALLDAV